MTEVHSQTDHVPSPDAQNSAEQHEQAPEAIQQLAGNLVHIAEQGDDVAVEGYLTDLLAGVEGVPGPERAAAFTFLAAEQRQEVRRAFVTAASDSLDRMATIGTDLQEPINDAGRRVLARLSAANTVYDQGVLSPARSGRIDSRRMGSAHAETVRLVGDGIRALDEQKSQLDRWVADHRTEGVQIESAFTTGRAHERALDEAVEVVDSEEGESKDLTTLIDSSVRSDVVRRMQAVIAEAQAAGTSPQEALTDMLDNPTDGVTPEVVAQAHRIVVAHADRPREITASIDSLLGDVKNQATLFGRRGLESVRRVEEVADIVQVQRTNFNVIIERVPALRTRMTQANSVHVEELRRTRQLPVFAAA